MWQTMHVLFLNDSALLALSSESQANRVVKELTKRAARSGLNFHVREVRRLFGGASDRELVERLEEDLLALLTPRDGAGVEA